MKLTYTIVLLGVLVWSGPVMAEHEHEDIIVGRTSGDQLAVEF